MPSKLYEKRRAFIVNVTYFAIIILLVFLFFKYALIWFMPFIIGFVFAAIANPLVTKICTKTKINRKLCAFFVMLLEYFILVFVFWILIAKIISSAQEVFADLPTYFDTYIVPTWNNIKNDLSSITSGLTPEINAHITSFTDGAFESLRDLLSGASEHFLSFLAQTTGQIPVLFLSVIFTILSSFFISMDYEKIKGFAKKLLPPKVVEIVSDTKLQLGKTLLKYVKAYGIIMTMTFLELLIGLSILKVENALGIAAIIAVFDILPVLGTGGIMVPWAIFNFASDNYFMGGGLLIIYFITIIVRNFAEPKIIGMQLGLHPMVTLITIYIGYRLFGFVGMIGCPVFVTILLALNSTGRLNFHTLIFGDSHGIDENATIEAPTSSEAEGSKSHNRRQQS